MNIRKRIIITASLIIVLSLILAVKTNTEMNRDNNVSRLYSGTLLDMMSPDIAPVYNKYSNPGLEYKKLDFEDVKIVMGRK